ncbi:hypothetical protein ACROYT_G040450 [Oculina patagonica]
MVVSALFLIIEIRFVVFVTGVCSVVIWIRYFAVTLFPSLYTSKITASTLNWTDVSGSLGLGLFTVPIGRPGVM